MFALHPRLAADSVPITRFKLCEVRLILDANYPWLIMVPQRDGIREVHDLPAADQQLLSTETSFVAKSLQEHYNALKMNVAALGNMVPQLHVHVIARFDTDPAWPAPIWGVVPALAYSESEQKQITRELEALLKARE